MRNPTLIFVVLVLSCLFVQPATSTAQGRCLLVVRNSSGRQFHRLHVSWNRDKDWGPNVLQSALKPGMSVELRDLVPAEYDVLLVDGNDNHCTLRGVQVYNNQTLTITEEALANRCRRN